VIFSNFDSIVVFKKKVSKIKIEKKTFFSFFNAPKSKYAEQEELLSHRNP
jgi:hypothetical protein